MICVGIVLLKSCDVLNIFDKLHFQNLILRNQSLAKTFKTILMVSAEGGHFCFGVLWCKSIGKTLELNIKQEGK